MYYLKKRLEVAAAHKLNLNYESKCSNFHGHNYIITVYCKTKELDENGMVIDFSKIKEIVMELDHKNLNEIFNFNPTAENMAKYFCDNIPKCYKVEVVESENNEVSYVQD